MPIKMSGPVGGPSRRQVMAGLGAGAAAIATGGTRAVAADGALKVGFISPRTGPLGGFGQTDGYVLDVTGMYEAGARYILGQRFVNDLGG